MMYKLVFTSVVVASSMVLISTAQAEQFVEQSPQGAKVVHTRLAPVVAHRLVPPYAGKHVYRGRAR